MGLLLEKDGPANFDIYTAIIAIGSFTNSTGRALLVRPHVEMTGLQTGSSITLGLYDAAFLSALSYAPGTRYPINQTSFSYTIPAPFYVPNGSTVVLTAKSNNISDLIVPCTVYWLDERSVDVCLYGGNDVSAEVTEGIPNVNAGLVGGVTPPVIQTEMAAALATAALDIAAKILLNKAVQNKATGEIVYYNNDGVTPIKTHTPTESETEYTRTPS